MPTVDWNRELKPLIEQYKGRKHPLEYGNLYQLLVMVVLSAQDSDRHINALAPALFAAFPDMQALARASEKSLLKHITGVRGAQNKAKWLLSIAKALKQDANIPHTLDGLTELPGIGRKSANVILRETGNRAEGIMVDLHVVRVAPRLGIASGTDPKKIEQQMMAVLDRRLWSEAGMALSFLGRETCRPTNPRHEECVMRQVCAYCKEMQGLNVKEKAQAKPTSKSKPKPKSKSKPKPKPKEAR